MHNIYTYFVFFLTAYLPIAATASEIVWLKDVTTRIQRDKRSLDDPDLPEKLSFLLKRNSDTVTLNLKRNYNVDPNADLYTVRNLDDGRSILEKTVEVEKEDMAYYQDMANGAFMTARCVRRSNGQCDILINGNIKIGDKNYDLQPSMDDFASRHVLENTDLLGKRYVLQDQSNIERDIPYIQELSDIGKYMPVQQDQLHIDRDITYMQGLSDIEIDMPVEQKQLYIERDQEFQHDKADKEKDMTVERKGNRKKDYTVKVVVALDSSVWDLFLVLVNTSFDATTRERKAEKNIRRYFSYIMNGVDQLYNGINDPTIAISVKIRAFVVFKALTQFPHRLSQVQMTGSTAKINASDYLDDLKNHDLSGAFNQIPDYDQVILFTRYDLYVYDASAPYVNGVSFPRQVCVPGYRVELIRLTDYFRTTSAAAHELGHSLGAVHDGDDTAKGCKADDFFVMAPKLVDFDPNKKYSVNPWLFSTCSVEAFKRTLVTKPDLTKKHVYTQAELAEWNKFMAKLPGVKYLPNMQCQLIIGPGSALCSALPGRRCRFMHCTHPTTHICLETYYSAAPGTECGINMWCQRGECVKINQT